MFAQMQEPCVVEAMRLSVRVRQEAAKKAANPAPFMEKALTFCDFKLPNICVFPFSRSPRSDEHLFKTIRAHSRVRQFWRKTH
jgi:hypothetical protein